MRDVWAILSEVADMEVRDDHGTEMQSVKTDSPLVRLLAEFLAGGHFTCTLNGGYRSDGNWETLAVSKFGDPVAVARCRAGHGSVIVLPQIQDKTRFLSELFTTVLPETAPHLFPHIERGKWTHRPEYELPRILEIKAKQREVEKKAKQDIRLLDEELAREREANGWVHTLLIGTDAELVDAVKKALSVLGFAKVIDVDAERDREGKSRREDLQIADQSPTLIVDIKGIGGFPSDEDAFQADKHAAIRMREQGRTDIIGLSIINHQRYLPPLDRENAMPFRKELIDASEERSLGLMTAWDLYRCVTNFQRLAWKSEHVRPLFYKKGRISVVPGHYQFIGKVAKVWTDKFGVVLEQGELKRGELIAVEFPVTFEEARADSLRVRDQAVDSASIGDPVGVPWDAEALKVREGLRVFRVSSP